MYLKLIFCLLSFIYSSVSFAQTSLHSSGKTQQLAKDLTYLIQDADTSDWGEDGEDVEQMLTSAILYDLSQFLGTRYNAPLIKSIAEYIVSSKEKLSSLKLQNLLTLLQTHSIAINKMGVEKINFSAQLDKAIDLFIVDLVTQEQREEAYKNEISQLFQSSKRDGDFHAMPNIVLAEWQLRIIHSPNELSLTLLLKSL